MFYSTTTEAINITPLLSDTAELAQYPLTKKEEADKSLTVDYTFNSSEVGGGTDYFSGSMAVLDYPITLTPRVLRIGGFGVVLPGIEERVEKYNLDEFIGILSDEEAEKMKKGIKLFRKHFDDDLNDRNKLLFGE